MNGYIEIVNANHLVFKGKISIRVHYINSGKEYVRDGAYDFKAYNVIRGQLIPQPQTIEKTPTINVEDPFGTNDGGDLPF